MLLRHSVEKLNFANRVNMSQGEIRYLESRLDYWKEQVRWWEQNNLLAANDPDPVNPT